VFGLVKTEFSECGRFDEPGWYGGESTENVPVCGKLG